MAILFMDSFDHYSSAAQMVLKWDYIAGSTSSTVGSGRYGTNGLPLVNTTYAVGKILSPSLTTVIFGMAVYAGASSSTLPVAQLMEGTTSHVELGWSHPGRKFTVTRNGTLLGTCSTVVPTGWSYVEAKIKIHDTAGEVVVRVNGAKETIAFVTGTETTQDTRNAGTGVINTFQLIGGGIASLTIDDLYICNTTAPNNDFLGDTRIEYLVPTGSGSRTQFTPSTGSNWQTVDETPASDTDYNSNNVPGAMDLFQMANLAGNGLVHGVQTISRAKKDDAGFRKAAPVFYKASGAGDTARWYRGSQVPVLDSFANLPLQVFDASPDTSVAWTVDEVNALQYGYAVGDAGMFTIDARLV